MNTLRFADLCGETDLSFKTREKHNYVIDKLAEAGGY